MFKRFLAILLIFAMTATSFQRYFVYASFELNKDYIAKNLCINRSRPWLHCNGKCYFMKKLRQAEENEKKQTAKDNLSRLEISFFQEPATVSFLQPVIAESSQMDFPAYTYQYSSHYIDAIFRPPKATA